MAIKRQYRKSVLQFQVVCLHACDFTHFARLLTADTNTVAYVKVINVEGFFSISTNTAYFPQYLFVKFGPY